jgi:hypothetical protein
MMASELSAWFWNDEFWLPPNVTWSSLQSTEPDISYASFSGDLSTFMPFPLVRPKDQKIALVWPLKSKN